MTFASIPHTILNPAGMTHDPYLLLLKRATAHVAALAAAHEDFEALYQAMADAVIDYQQPTIFHEEE